MKNEEEVPMKNRSMLSAAVLAFLILCVCATGAFAENREGAITVTPFFGGLDIDRHIPWDATNWAYGLGLGYNISEKLAAELTFHYAAPRDNQSYVGYNPAPNYDGKTYIYKLDLLYHFIGLLPGDLVLPYIAGGIGDIKYSTDRPSVSSSDDSQAGVYNKNDFLVDAGGGLKIFLTRDLALRGDVRYMLDFNSAHDHNSLLYTVGLTYEIGGKTKEAAPEPVAAPEPAPAPAPAPAVVTPPPAPAPKEQGTITFRNILFDFNKYNIKPESYPILDEVTDYLKANPNVKMEVQGYCDNKGTYKYNMKLSDERANAVRKYLVDKGIAGDRLTAKGYSFDNPIASNATEEGRALNRRVVFKPIQ